MNQLNWGNPVEGWQLSISVDKDKFLLGEPIYVTMVTKNISNKDLRIPASSKWTTYWFHLRDEFSKVPLTRFGRRMEENRGEGSYAEPEIPPDDTIVLEMPVSRLFDLSLSGAYTLEVSRMVFRQGTSEEVPLVSNKISFEIVEE